LRLGVPVYAFGFGIADDIAHLQKLRPTEYRYRDVPLYCIRSLPLLWMEAETNLVTSYGQLYRRLTEERLANVRAQV
jgi:hypothetical protein